ncbi:hypothetical protein U9M48_012083 [Paspalum notatum var. saurae]|uniref:DUF4218 domain-containing protein n=1 Tax=Paspalum notatum var. saurae TaxID=547442 RepID=A0AAQ3WIB7_PASNO
MWAYERFMSSLNHYVLNRAYPEGSMIEAYCTEEVVECCMDYLVDHKDRDDDSFHRAAHMYYPRGKPQMLRFWIMKEHKHRFTSWLMDLNLPEGSTVEEVSLKRLASGPSSRVTTWQAYDINDQTFYIAAKDKKSVCQNSGVRIDAIDDVTGSKITYYGFIEDTWELDYGSNIQILVFRCQWVKHPQRVDNYGLAIVDLTKVEYKDDPWVLATCIG